ncbi:MAG: 3-phenylpropionate/trans-cinnamate dioxygenase ferredoxin reductase component [Actinomycetota bacterium]|nr:3-phenylpropionate/trans-cinnamate dioxygenase ferredoxin reductase component [Actinomycetota bacterium]
MRIEGTFVIVGASLTGAKAAEVLRLEGFGGRVVLIGEEPERPYERPPLSKDYLRGEVGPEKAYVHDERFYGEHEIELRTSARVVAIDPANAQVVLEDFTRLRYDRLLLATGAVPRRVSIPGSDLPGVHYLRTMKDSESLRQAITPASRVVVVGAGWIGSEVAASARQIGADVVLIERGNLPLERVLGPEVGAVYRDLHSSHGVEFLSATGIDAIGGIRSVERVRTSTGRRIACDVVVIGVGAAPRVELAEAAGLLVEDGIAVDERLETSVPGIFAAGDVAAAWHPFYQARIRVEHWANALHQGEVAARNMLGLATPYERLPYFFSDQYDLGMEYTGYAPSWDKVVFRGDPQTGQFIAFWLSDGRVVAGMNANVWDVTGPIGELIRRRMPIDAARLADPDVPLEDLVGTPHAKR